jgi:hypothetical protein
MEVAGMIAAVVLVPVLAGFAVAAVVRPGSGWRRTAGVAGLAALGVVLVVVIVGFVVTPEAQCVKKSCDDGYGVGAMSAYPPAFALAFVGALVGRRVPRRMRNVLPVGSGAGGL